MPLREKPQLSELPGTAPQPEQQKLPRHLFPIRLRLRTKIIGSVLLLVLVASVVWIGSIVRDGQKLEDRLLDYARANDFGAILSGNSDEFVTNRATFESLHGSFDALSKRAAPLLAISQGLRWVPFIGDELSSVDDLTDRISSDFRAAAITLDAVDQLYVSGLRVDRGATSGFSSIESLVDDYAGLARSLSAKLSDQRVRLFDGWRGPRPPQIIVSDRRWGRLIDIERQLGLALDLTLASTELTIVASDLETLGHGVASANHEGTLDLQMISDRLGELHDRAETLGLLFQHQDESIGGADRLSALLMGIASIGLGGQLATGSFASVIEPLDADHAGLIGNGTGVRKALDAIHAERESFVRAEKLLNEGQAELADQFDSAPTSVIGRLLGLFSELFGYLERLKVAMSLIVEIEPLSRSLLGFAEPKTILVLGHSADELRPTGGFISGAWTIETDKGDITEIRYMDIVQVDDRDRLVEYPRPPSSLEQHMNAGVWLLRDASWEPNFPTVARIALEMLELGQQRPADAVVAINQWTLQTLLGGMGGISIPERGIEIKAENFLSTVEEGTDEEGRAYMDLIMRGFIQRLTQPFGQEDMVRLAIATDRVLREHQLLIYEDDPVAQASIQRLGWAGELREEHSDYLYVADSNIGWNKVDRNIQRAISYRVALNPLGSSTASLTLRYANRGEAPTLDCERQWSPLEEIHDYHQLKNGCYWNYVRAYVPEGSKLMGSDSMDLPEGSVAARSGPRQAGSSSIDEGNAYGKDLFGALVRTPAGETQRVTFVYELPPRVLHKESDAYDYRLMLQPQTGARGRDTTVVIHLPDGYEVESVSTQGLVDLGEESVSFAFQLLENAIIEIRMKPNNSRATT